MYDDAKVLTVVKPGDKCRAQPYAQMAVSRSHSRPVQLPYTVPVTVDEVHDDAGRPEYVRGTIDPTIYGHRPWQSDQQLWVLSRGELHAPDCRCKACS